MAAGSTFFCCQGCKSCGNDSGCPDDAPTLLPGCTGKCVASNRANITVSGSASGTIFVTGTMTGESMPGSGLGTHDWYFEATFTISWSASVTGSIRALSDNDQYTVSGDGDATGSVTWSVSFGGGYEPLDWTETLDEGVTASGSVNVGGSGDSITAGGSVGCNRRKRFSFTDGLGNGPYYVWIDCGGGVSPIADSVTTAGTGTTICDGDPISFSDSSDPTASGIGVAINDDPYSGTPSYSAQASSITGTFRRETESDITANALECSSCSRAIDVIAVKTDTSYVTGSTKVDTFTGRFVQQCATTRCGLNVCRWVVDADGVTRVRVIDGGTPSTTTYHLGTEINSGLRPTAGPIHWNIGTAVAANFTTTGNCPTDSPTPIAIVDDTQPDGSAAGHVEWTFDITPSDPVEGDPTCYCDDFDAYDTGEERNADTGEDLHYEIENANESGVFMPAVIETDNGFLVYYDPPKTGNAYIGIDKYGSNYSGLRSIRTTINVRHVRDIYSDISSDNQTIAVYLNGTLIATNATPNDNTSFEQKHEVLYPESVMVKGPNSVVWVVRDNAPGDIPEASAFKNEWRRH